MEPSSPPSSSIARLLSTSFTFMLLCVPLPVCHTTSGNCSSNLPAITSSAAVWMAAAIAGARPKRWLTDAAAFLSTANARISGSGMRSPAPPPPILKLSRERCVWQPQYLSLGTSTEPMVSYSMRMRDMGGE